MCERGSVGGREWGWGLKKRGEKKKKKERGEKIPRKHHLFIRRLELSGTLGENFDIMHAEDE